MLAVIYISEFSQPTIMQLHLTVGSPTVRWGKASVEYCLEMCFFQDRTHTNVAIHPPFSLFGTSLFAFA